MSEMFKISEAATMGIHAAIYLAANCERVVPLKEVVEKLEVSEAHLSKVFQRLGKAGILSASRGPQGGYVLSKEPREITLLEVYEAIEGKIRPRSCLFAKPICNDNKCCGLGLLIGRQTTEMRDFLGKTFLTDALGIFSKEASS